MKTYEYNTANPTSDIDIPACFDEFKTKYNSDPDCLEKVTSLLLCLEREHSFPFYLFDVLNDQIPKILGDNGSKYLTYILRYGIPNNDDLDDKMAVDLFAIVSRFGIPFVCAERFVKNPMDYGVLQQIHAIDSDKIYLRIIRSDKKKF